MGPRRGGLNGRRNAVKPFCHSRRSRAARDNSSGVLRDRSAPLAFLLFTSIFRVLEYVQLVLIYIHIVVFMTMITVLKKNLHQKNINAKVLAIIVSS